jgi:RNA polymerase sigma-70 factor (ECF subfamily)
MNPLDSAMTRYVQGDADAFAAIYGHARRPLTSFLSNLCRDRVLAEDLTHETLLRMHAARADFRPGAPVLTWAFTIARRVFIDDLRKRRHEGASPSRELGGDLQDPAPLADQLLDRMRLSRRLDAAIAELPPTQAAVCRLVKDEGLTPSETAGSLGSNPGTARVRAHRAFKALRAKLAANDTGELRASAG